MFVGLCVCEWSQVCSATSRVLIHSSLRESLLALLVEKIQQITLCDSLLPSTLAHTAAGGGAMGPVISKTQADKIWKYIFDAKAAGVSVLCGGEVPTDPALGNGYFVPPTVGLSISLHTRHVDFS